MKTFKEHILEKLKISKSNAFIIPTYEEFFDLLSEYSEKNGEGLLDLNEIINGIKTCKTVGFLLKETKDWICLGQTICDEQFRGGYLIYKKNIVLMYGLSSDTKEEPIRRILK